VRARVLRCFNQTTSRPGPQLAGLEGGAAGPEGEGRARWTTWPVSGPGAAQCAPGCSATRVVRLVGGDQVVRPARAGGQAPGEPRTRAHTPPPTGAGPICLEAIAPEDIALLKGCEHE